MITRYLRDDNGIPWATIVAFGPDHVAASVCSQKDQFSKRYGRWLAVRRLLAGATAPRLFNAAREAAVAEAIIDVSLKASSLEDKYPGFFAGDQKALDNVHLIVDGASRRETNLILNELAGALVDDETVIADLQQMYAE